MDIIINLTPITDFLQLPPSAMIWRFFILYGWLPIAIAYLWGVKELWMMYIQGQWARTQEYTFLAIDIPRGNEQSPKAVENLFSYLAGAHGTQNLIEKYWEGVFQLSFSFEIVSIEGYTQFIVRTPVKFRNLVEAAVYSQYPDAEITEVQDYTEGSPRNFPDPEYDLWGTEFIQAKNTMFPIKTYEEFEHELGEDLSQYRDPMASLTSLMSSLGKGEQLWYQIILRPIGFDWMDKGEQLVSEILKEKITPEKNILDKMGDGLLSLIGKFSEVVYSLWSEIPEASESEKDDSLKMMNLKPKEKKQVEAVHNKISKLAFDIKIRVIYLAKKDVINKQKVVNGFVGYMKQFASLDLNNLKPEYDKVGTSTHYFLKGGRLNARKRKVINNYISRDGSAGVNMGLLNIEELASIWHFPIESAVKSPMLQKAPGRKAESPMNLPIGEAIVPEDLVAPEFTREEELKQALPFEEEMEEIANAAEAEVVRKGKTVDISGVGKTNGEKMIKKGAPPANLPF